MSIIGGLNEVSDVKILVLYILNYAGTPLSRDTLIHIALDAGSVQYFDLAQAIDELLMTGPIDITSSSEPDMLRITEMGKQTFAMFEKSLPYSVRRKNQSALLKMLSDMRKVGSVKSDIRKKDMGYEVVCTLMDGEDTLLEYKLFVPTQIQAQMVVDQFEKNPSEKYKNILALLIDEKLFEEQN